MYFLGLLCCILIHNVLSDDFSDVAVIIGGLNGSHTFLDVEVYSYRKENMSQIQNCPDTEIYPAVPNFPLPINRASAVYLPNIGIYVCGGVYDEDEGKKYNHHCFKYNPRESRRQVYTDISLYIIYVFHYICIKCCFY